MVCDSVTTQSTRPPIDAFLIVRYLKVLESGRGISQPVSPAKRKTSKKRAARPAPSSGRTVKVGVIGLGTVGTGTVAVLLAHQREIERRLGGRLRLKVICSRTIHKRNLSWMGRKVEITSDWRQVVRDPDIDVVVELVGQPQTALSIARETLKNGKHLVTANKFLVAEHGVELFRLSRQRDVSLGIEACVAGGTPVLHAIRDGLAGEEFLAAHGILNGTTNYILTEMERRGCRYSEALGEAQQKGYAEPDPAFDVEGYDARYKISILSMICFGALVKVDDITVQGITRIEPVDFAYAARLGRTIRLMAGATRRPGGKLEISTGPLMVPRDSVLANVTGANMGLILVGSKGGTTLYSGQGAGGDPTGVAVISDVVGIARLILAGASSKVFLGYQSWKPFKVVSPEEGDVHAYLRFVVHDRPGILAQAAGILARYKINIDSVLQEPGTPRRRMVFVMTLEPTPGKQLRKAIKQIRKLPFLVSPPLVIPFSDLP